MRTFARSTAGKISQTSLYWVKPNATPAASATTTKIATDSSKRGMPNRARRSRSVKVPSSGTSVSIPSASAAYQPSKSGPNAPLPRSASRPAASSPESAGVSTPQTIKNRHSPDQRLRLTCCGMPKRRRRPAAQSVSTLLQLLSRTATNRRSPPTRLAAKLPPQAAIRIAAQRSRGCRNSTDSTTALGIQIAAIRWLCRVSKSPK